MSDLYLESRGIPGDTDIMHLLHPYYPGNHFQVLLETFLLSRVKTVSSSETRPTNHLLINPIMGTSVN